MVFLKKFNWKALVLLLVLAGAAGGYVPLTVDLEIMKYVDQRGEKKLRFDPALEFKDPYGLQEKFF
jgi:nitrite reductase (cytochrome c-552)